MFESRSQPRSKRAEPVGFGGDVLEEFRKDREAADNDASGNFGPGPEAKVSYVIAGIRRAGKFPSVVDACDRCYASARYIS